MTAPLYDYAGVIHLHSVHSDGTGTVDEIARAGRENGLDFVLLTDHDTLAARRLGEEGWYGGTLLLAGVEISPERENHFLAFGLDDAVDHEGMGPGEICSAVAEGGGFGFLAHPFSKGNPRFPRAGTGMPWRDLDCGNFAGIELWSFVTDSGEALDGFAEFFRFIRDPLSIVDHPPDENVRQWDRLCRERPVVAIGGLDAHQLGIRVGNRVPLRLMSYRRSFRHLRTHVLSSDRMTGDLEADRKTIFSALRRGSCYLAMDSLAPARGFRFWAEREGTPIGMGEEGAAGNAVLRVTSPRPAAIRIMCDGRSVFEVEGSTIDQPVSDAGVYRVEVRLSRQGSNRTWILSNPVYLRD